MKICPNCRKELNESSFQKCSANKDGLQYYCRECNNAYNRERYYKNHDYEIERARKRREKNPNYGKDYYWANVEYLLKQKHDYYMAHKKEHKEWKSDIMQLKEVVK